MDFARYEIIGELSRGGMGVVYRAQHRELKTEVALKVMIGAMPTEDDLLRFEREAKVLAPLRHPSIVRLTDYGIEGGRPFLVMDLVKGKSLKSIVDAAVEGEGGVPDFEWTKKVMGKIAAALAYCHANRLVHRDVKPHNILVDTATDEPVLVDFGLIKSGHEANTTRIQDQIDGTEAAGLTQSGTLLGTPSFMAPEQFDSEAHGEVDEAADVWGLGSTLFYCLTGRTPFQGDNTIALYKDLTRNAPPDPQRKNRAVPRELSELVKSAMALEQSERPSAAEFAEVLMPPPRVSRLGFVVGSAGLLLALFGLGTYAITHRPRRLGSISEPPNLTRDEKVLLFGDTQPFGAEVLVKGGFSDVTTKSDPNGRFTITVLLAEGRNELVANVIGSTEPNRQFTVVRDSLPPRVDFPSARDGTVVLDRKGNLALRVTEPHLEHLELGGLAVTPDQTGAASVPLADVGGGRTIRLKSRDKVGNELSRTLQVRDFFHDLLWDRTRWQEADPADQDVVIDAVAQGLKPAFALAGTAVYACDRARHRIARFKHLKTGIELHLVPGGRFLMGLPKNKEEFFSAWASRDHEDLIVYRPDTKHDTPAHYMAGAQPDHEVKLPPFLIGRFEVTQRQWDLIGGRDMRAEAKISRAEHLPIEWVYWQDAKGWVEKVGDGLRLPSESEWEYACRAGVQEELYWGASYADGELIMTHWRRAAAKLGKDPTKEQWFQVVAQQGAQLFPEAWKRIWWLRNSGGKAHSVLEHADQGNAFGLSDMLGNVREWCEDVYVNRYDDGPFDEMPRLGTQPRHVDRGGCYKQVILNNMASSRHNINDPPTKGAPNYEQAFKESLPSHCGLRVVRSLPGR